MIVDWSESKFPWLPIS